MHVEQVLDATGPLVRCVIRCTSGTVRPGVRVTIAESDGIREQHSSASVLKIWRYGKEVDMVDVPHGAMVELEGELANAVTQGVTLSGLE